MTPLERVSADLAAKNKEINDIREVLEKTRKQLEYAQSQRAILMAQHAMEEKQLRDEKQMRESAKPQLVPVEAVR